MKFVGVLVSCVFAVGCGEVVKQSPDSGTPPDADPCATATCSCAVATEDTDCGPHQYCDTTGPGRSCACVAGYTDQGGTCTWTGAVQDPGIASATAWTATGATLNGAAAGSTDPGEADWAPASLCSLGTITQTITMPTYKKAEPLVLELTYKDQLLSQPYFENVPFGVSLDGGWFQLQPYYDTAFHSVRVCLSEGGYAPPTTVGKGAPVKLTFGPYQRPNTCPNTQLMNFAVDHVNIVPAMPNECGAMPGIGPNWNAETTGGWTFSTTGQSSSGFLVGAGAAGTKGAAVMLGTRCDSASMATTFNVPRVANPAIDFYTASQASGTTTGSPGAILQFGSFNMPAADTGQNTTIHMCLPPSLRGQMGNVGFYVSGGSGTCTDYMAYRVSADNMKVVEDPSCMTGANLTNAGFESGSLPFGAYGSRSTSTADAVVRSGAGAHSGTYYLSLESHGRCSSAGYNVSVVVPQPSGTDGPVLTFWANVGVNPDAQTTVTAAGGGSVTLNEGGGYQQYKVCLNPLYAGRPQQVSIAHYGGTGLCDNSNYTLQTAAIDDLAVGTDPACPAQ